jgi:murein L,D-transpeptidase YafK
MMPSRATRPPVLLPLVVGFVASVAVRAEPVRVAEARKDKLVTLQAAFAEKGVPYPAKELFVRAFKKERLLELWAGDGKAPLVLVKSWPVCASSGTLGPKRQQGDLQVPEGVYTLDKLNPVSSYHLSLHVDYPNRADRIAGRARKIADLGGDIMVHGECVTIGCIPIENDPIEELYLAIHDAKLKPPIHIFPARLDDAGLHALVSSTTDTALQAFWRDLAPIQRAFDEQRRVPRVAIGPDGRYTVAR